MLKQRFTNCQIKCRPNVYVKGDAKLIITVATNCKKKKFPPFLRGNYIYGLFVCKHRQMDVWNRKLVGNRERMEINFVSGLNWLWTLISVSGGGKRFRLCILLYSLKSYFKKEGFSNFKLVHTSRPFLGKAILDSCTTLYTRWYMICSNFQALVLLAVMGLFRRL